MYWNPLLVNYRYIESISSESFALSLKNYIISNYNVTWSTPNLRRLQVISPPLINKGEFHYRFTEQGSSVQVIIDLNEDSSKTNILAPIDCSIWNWVDYFLGSWSLSCKNGQGKKIDINIKPEVSIAFLEPRDTIEARRIEQIAINTVYSNEELTLIEDKFNSYSRVFPYAHLNTFLSDNWVHLPENTSEKTKKYREIYKLLISTFNFTDMQKYEKEWIMQCIHDFIKVKSGWNHRLIYHYNEISRYTQEYEWEEILKICLQDKKFYDSRDQFNASSYSRNEYSVIQAKVISALVPKELQEWIISNSYKPVKRCTLIS